MEGINELRLEELDDSVEIDETSYCCLISGVCVCCMEVADESDQS